MGDAINYAALPKSRPQNCNTRDVCYKYDDAASLRERLWNIDPKQDGSLTKAEVVQHLRGIQWQKLVNDYQKFYTKFAVWENSCRSGGVFDSQKCNSSLQTDWEDDVSNIFGIEQGHEIFDTIGYWPRSGRGVPAFFRVQWADRTLFVAGIMVTGDIQIGGKSARIVFGRLHQIKNAKIVRLSKTVLKIVITHYSGVYFLKNPTGASITRKSR